MDLAGQFGLAGARLAVNDHRQSYRQCAGRRLNLLFQHLILKGARRPLRYIDCRRVGDGTSANQMMPAIMRDDITLNFHKAACNRRLRFHEDKGSHPVTNANNLVGPKLVDDV